MLGSESCQSLEDLGPEKARGVAQSEDGTREDSLIWHQRWKVSPDLHLCGKTEVAKRKLFTEGANHTSLINGQPKVLATVSLCP